VEGYVAVPDGFAAQDDHFALRVAGDSMIGAGIFDGDLVVVRSQQQADDGDIVAALLAGPAEDEATVKRLGHDGPRVMLIPENPALEPVEMTDGRIMGKVVAVLRKL
jgi:repressor LexA